MPSATPPSRAPISQTSASTLPPAPAQQRSYTTYPSPSSALAPLTNPLPRPDHYDGHPLVAPHFSPTPPLTPVERVYTAYGHPAQAAEWTSVAARLRRGVKALYAKHGLTECRRLGLYIAGSEADVQDPGSERMMILVVELVDGEVGRWRELEAEVWGLLGEVVGEERGVCVRFYRCWDGAGEWRRGVARRVERPPSMQAPIAPPPPYQAPAQAQVLRAFDTPEERARFFEPYRQNERGSNDDDDGDSTEEETGSTGSSPSDAGEGSVDEQHLQGAEHGSLPDFATVPAQPPQPQTRNPNPYPFLTAPMASSSRRTTTRPRHAARDELFARSFQAHQASHGQARERPTIRHRTEPGRERRAGDVFDSLMETFERDVAAGEEATRAWRAARRERRLRGVNLWEGADLRE